MSIGKIKNHGLRRLCIILLIAALIVPYSFAVAAAAVIDFVHQTIRDSRDVWRAPLQ